jgi:hypothetical protein
LSGVVLRAGLPFPVIRKQSSPIPAEARNRLGDRRIDHHCI